MEQTQQLKTGYMSQREGENSPFSSIHKPIKKLKRNFSVNIRSQRSLLFKKPIALLLLWNSMVYGYQFMVLRLVTSQKQDSFWLSHFLLLLTHFVLSDLFYPLAGWLSDTKLGRYRVLKYSIWLMWISGGIALLSLIPNNTHISLGMKIAVLIINSISLAGFNVNIILFGLNHLIDAPSDQSSAFIRWYYWTRNMSFMALSILNVIVCMHVTSKHTHGKEYAQSKKYSMLIILTVCTLLLSLALGSDFIFGRILKVHYKKSDPFQLIRKVLMYTWRHSYPELRSAFTYNESFTPKRIDYAKEMYGGPFKYEQVEDVKSFLNLLFAIVAIGIFSFMYVLSFSSVHYFIKRIQISDDFMKIETCWPLDNFYWIVNPLMITVLIPVYEFLLLPCLQKYVPRTLRRVGLAFVLLLLGLISLFVLDLTSKSKNFSTCTINISNATNVTISSYNIGLVFIPVSLLTLAEMLGNIAAFEFICAQTPEIFKGFMMGLLFAVQAIFHGLATLIMMPFMQSQYNQDVKRGGIHCLAGFYSMHMVLGVLALICYVFAVKKYKRRERNPVVNEQQLIESHYEHMFNERDRNEERIITRNVTIND